MPAPRTEEPTSGPMKTVAIFLAILCAILGYLLYKKGSTASTGLEAVVKNRDTLSNQVDVLTTKLMEEQGTSALTRSNLQHSLERRTSDAHFFSNRVVQTILRLQDAQREARDAQVEIQAKTATTAAWEAQREDFNRRLELVPKLQKELIEARVQLGQLSRERDDFAQSLGRLQVDMAEVERTLADPGLLRLQLKKAEDAAQIRKAAASGRRVHILDPRMQLELQPDGTVRPIASASSETKK